mgnify:CR=1 FL=1
MDSASESILVRVAFVAEQVRDVEDEVIRRNNEHIQCQERKTRRWIDILAKKLSSKEKSFYTILDMVH